MSARALLTPGLEIDGRIGVRIDDYANSPLNGKQPAYLYNPDKAAFGLNPWRTINSVEHGAGESKGVGPRYVVYLLPEHAAQITEGGR